MQEQDALGAPGLAIKTCKFVWWGEYNLAKLYILTSIFSWLEMN